jgi:hypothetical protein
MQPYKGYFIDGAAKMIHPFDPSWYPAGTVLKPGRLGSVVEITRFDMPSFKMEPKELAEWFGLELARVVVEECLLPL